jgi:uncharacterized repeat protein (TIGR02059 family)
MLKKTFIVLFLGISIFASANTFYVAPVSRGGNDSNPGKFDTPWLTWQKAFSTAVAGDTVYFRAGVYPTTANGVGVGIAKVGTAINPICFFNYPGDYPNFPVLDCAASGVVSNQNYGIRMNHCSYVYIKGLQIENVHEVIGVGGICEGLDSYYNDHCRFENMIIHDIHGVGMAMYQTHYSEVINCDAYTCGDIYSLGRPGDWGTGFTTYTDEFTNGYCSFYGCRAWDCSDQGYGDGGSESYVEFVNCWSMDNGLMPLGIWGMGSGFKLGYLPTKTAIAKNYRVLNCIAAHNHCHGFNGNENGYAANMDLFNNFAYDNGDGLENQGNNNSIEEFGFNLYQAYDNKNRILENNLSYANYSGDFHVYDFIGYHSYYLAQYNSWNTPPGITVTAADFQSLDYTQLYRDRKPDGSLPDITFGKLASTSHLIDAGIDVGLPYNGTAPDLGYSESLSGSVNPANPIYVSSSIENSAPALLEMTYNLSLANIVPPISAFAVTVNSAARTVSSIAVSGTSVTLKLNSPVVYGDDVNVAYTKPSSNPLQTPAGGQAASFSAQKVTNNVASVPIPVYVSSSVENATPSRINIVYNLDLANIVPPISAFDVTVNSAARPVNSLAVSGTSVTLTLNSPVVYGDDVNVAYTKPSSNPLQTAAGSQAVSFTTQKVTNNVASIPVPVYVSSSVENATPSKINIVYSLSLANIVPPVSAFAVTVNSAARTVNSVAVSGTTVILTLASAVAYDDAVKLAYTKPSSNPLQTAAGGQAASFATQTVSNNVQLNNTAPVVMVNYQSTTYAGFVNELDASGSYDTNNDKLTYSWAIPGNIPVSSTTGSTIKYLSPIVDANQKVQFVLNVSDGKTTQSKIIPVEIAPYEPGLDIAEVVKVEASDYLSPNYPSNIIDGNIGTMWAAKGDGQWLLLELKEPFSVQHVKLAFQTGQKEESYFDILGSDDKVNWGSILTKSNSCAFSGDLQVFDFPPSKTVKEFRYIKVIGHGNSADTWNYISEFRIFGYRHKNPTSYEELPVKIYPNPAHDFFNVKIEASSIIYDFIKIVSFTGKILLQEKIDPDVSEFRMPINLKNGIYIVQMGSDDLTLFTQKLIVRD